jgi:hypothetical protein
MAAFIVKFIARSQRNTEERIKPMKTSVALLIFALALLSVPAAHAGQAPDPEFVAARLMLEDARACVPEPYYLVECFTQGGGTAEVRFTKNGAQIIAQAIQDGLKEWRVTTQGMNQTCNIAEGELFSNGPGFRQWKRYLSDTCEACVNDPACLNLGQ